MLSFILNNKPFILDESSSIRISWVNPATQFSSIPGDAGRGINIPVNDNNQILLGNPERFERDIEPGDNEFEGFEVRYSGVLLLAGTLIIQEAPAGSYKGWLRSNIGNLGSKHREQYIYDIDAFNQDVLFTNKANYNPLSDPYGCPQVINPSFFKGKGATRGYTHTIVNPDWYENSDEDQYKTEEYESGVLTEGFRKYAYSRVNALNPDNTVKLGTFIFGGIKLLDYVDISAVSPMLFLNYVIKTLLKDANFFVDANAIASHPDLQKLLIYNNYDVTNMGFGTVEDVPYNSSFPDGETTKSHTLAIEFVYRNYDEPFRYKSLLPKVKLKEFILGIQNSLNVCFVFRPDGMVDIIDREEILKGSALDIDKYMVGIWEPGTKKDVTLKFKFTHDDNDAVFNERWDDIDDRREDEKEAMESWSALDTIEDPDIPEVRYLKDYGAYAEYAWTQKVSKDPMTGEDITEDRLGWNHLSMGLQHGFFNRGKDEEELIETGFSTLDVNYVTQIPICSQVGNINSIKFAYSSFSPRLLFYLGDNQAKSATDNLTFDWEKPNTGLLATRWPLWNRFWSGRLAVKRSAYLLPNMLDYVLRNITSKFRSREGEFIIDEMSTEFGLHRIGETKIKGYKI